MEHAQNPEIDAFRPHIGTNFRVSEPDANTEILELVEITELPASGIGRRSRAFTLVFEGRPDDVLPQATYELTHPKMGALAIFIVPLGPAPESSRMRYEAVFT